MAHPITESPTAALGGAESPDIAGSRFVGRGSDGLRARAARGTVINAGFLIGFNLLSVLKAFAIAAFLSVEDYGVWGLLAVSLSTLFFLVQVGVDDKYLQQDEADQEAAFQRAFTLQVVLSGVFVAVALVAMPLYALAYGNWEIVLPGYVAALAIPAMALQAPLWVFYRRMDYFRQRVLQAVDPVVGLAVTIALAAAGLGYWSLVLGLVCGAWAAALAAMRASPYSLALRYDRGTLREYVGFSGPLFLSAVSGLLVAIVPVLVTQRSAGIAAVGALAVAATISTYANRVDEIVTDTLYPAVCAVKDRMDLLLETFLKSNRLALLWAAPAGAAIVLFGPDLVSRVLGQRWELAVFAIQAFGLAAAVNQIGFNWTAYYRALGRTRPIAVASVAMLVSVMAVAVPLLLWKGIDGFAVGMGVVALVLVWVRLAYLSKLFSLAPIVVNTARGVAPTLPALAAVLAVRALSGGGERTLADALVEASVFIGLVVAGTLIAERALLRELLGYLRSDRPQAQVAGV